jgi:hypothetical protein
VRECAGEPDEQISLEVYNAVWPHDAITMDEVRSFKASVVALPPAVHPSSPTSPVMTRFET